MTRIAFVNGEFLPFAEARVPIMDRGFLFADGIYEVSAVLDGALVDNEAHLARLDRALAAIGIPQPYAPERWTAHETELVRRNGLVEGIVYMQVTRGVAARAVAFPPALSPPGVMFTHPKPILASPRARAGAGPSPARGPPRSCRASRAAPASGAPRRPASRSRNAPSRWKRRTRPLKSSTPARPRS